MVTKNYVKSKLNATSNRQVKQALKHENTTNYPKCNFNTCLNFKKIIIPFIDEYFAEDCLEAIEHIFLENMLDIPLDDVNKSKTGTLNAFTYFSSSSYNFNKLIFDCEECSNYIDCNNRFSDKKTLRLNLIFLSYLLNQYNIIDNNIPSEIKKVISNILSKYTINDVLNTLNTSYIGVLINNTKWNINIAKVLMTMNLISYNDFYNILKYNNSITIAIASCNQNNPNTTKNLSLDDNIVKMEVMDSQERGSCVDNYYDMIISSNALTELHQMIGLTKVKEQLKNLHDLLCFRKLTENKLNLPEIYLNCIFQGNPGTGKTKTAKLYADILYHTGFIKSDKLVCVSASDLIAEYVGATAIKTANVIKDSLGGVLFVDEAYQLTPKGEKDFGRECIATFVREMTEHKNDLVIIFAGYKKEMQEFIEINPGMKSRITNFINFDDYSIDELYEIFKLNVNNANFKLANNMETELKNIFKNKSGEKCFGNARFIENLFQDIILEHSKNIMNKIRNKEINTNDNSIKLLDINDIPNIYI